MSTDEAPRLGSLVDLSKRMDALERNHGDLALTVARVEQNQKHAEELNRLRFDALDATVRSLASQLAEFMKRIEGIITGEVDTVQTRQGRAIIEEWTAWRKAQDERLDALEDAQERQRGVWVAVGGAKGALLAFAAIASPVIVVLVALLKP